MRVLQRIKSLDDEGRAVRRFLKAARHDLLDAIRIARAGRRQVARAKLHAE
jgi:hypothetical protein